MHSSFSSTTASPPIDVYSGTRSLSLSPLSGPDQLKAVLFYESPTGALLALKITIIKSVGNSSGSIRGIEIDSQSLSSFAAPGFSSPFTSGTRMSTDEVSGGIDLVWFNSSRPDIVLEQLEQDQTVLK